MTLEAMSFFRRDVPLGIMNTRIRRSARTPTIGGRHTSKPDPYQMTVRSRYWASLSSAGFQPAGGQDACPTPRVQTDPLPRSGGRLLVGRSDVKTFCSPYSNRGVPGAGRERASVGAPGDRPNVLFVAAQTDQLLE